jgi:hypothetical protein
MQVPKITDTFKSALAYHRDVLCVIPLNGKRPALEAWKLYQSRRSTEDDLQRWQRKGLLKNLGVVCGKVSHSNGLRKVFRITFMRSRSHHQQPLSAL